MSNNYDQEAALSSALQRAIKTVTRGCVVVDGVVLSVDETKFTCDVQIGTGVDVSTFFDVPLRVLTSNQASIIEIPEPNTPCLIGFRDGNTGNPQMWGVHKALKILVKCDNIVFNDGTLGGLIVLNDAVSRWNKIEQDINALKTAFSSWIVAPNDGGQALKTATAAWYGQPLAITTQTDVENPKIKQ